MNETFLNQVKDLIANADKIYFAIDHDFSKPKLILEIFLTEKNINYYFDDALDKCDKRISEKSNDKYYLYFNEYGAGQKYFALTSDDNLNILDMVKTFDIDLSKTNFIEFIARLDFDIKVYTEMRNSFNDLPLEFV